MLVFTNEFSLKQACSTLQLDLTPFFSLLLGKSSGSTFAILNTAGEAQLTVTERLPLPDSEHYQLLQLLDDGFVMKHTDDQHYRVYKLEQQVLRTFKLDPADPIAPTECPSRLLSLKPRPKTLWDLSPNPDITAIT